MHRPLFRSCLALGLFIVLVWSGSPRTAAAQVAPQTDPSIILSGPIRSTDPGSVTVELVRVFLTLESMWQDSAGTAAIHASTGPDSLLILNVADLEVLDVRLPDLGVEAQWKVVRGRLTIQVPESAEGTWRVDINYRVRSAFRVLESNDEVVAVWTSSLPGRATWMPLPVDEVSASDYHVSIAAPEDWNIVVSGGAEDTMFELEGRSIAQTTFTQVYPRAIGFMAWIPDSESGLTRVSPDEAMQSVGLDANWLERILGENTLDSYVLLTIEGESVPSAFPGFGIRTMGQLVRDDGWMRQYERLWRDYQLAITPVLGRLAPTDYWIDTALSAWLAVEHLRKTEGEAAAGVVLDELRQRYLSESARYVRPLVWDRWHIASDLRDRHAEAKGAWVFRMLHERLGEDVFMEALRRFMDEARRGVVDSETLRQQFEVVSREDLGQFFDTWVYAAGHPVISLSYQYDPSTEQTNLALKQHQEGALVPETFVFDAAFQYSTLAETNSVTIRVDERERNTRLPTGIEPRFIHPDALATVPLDFENPPSKSDLVSQLRYSMDAASTIRSLHLLSAATIDPALLLGLRSVITATTDPVILAEAAPILGSVAPSSSALALLISWSSHENPRVRTAATTALAEFKDAPAAYDAALAVANAGSDAYELAAAVRTLVILRPGGAWPVLRSALVTPSDGELVRIQALELIGSDTADPDDIARAVLPLLDGSPDVGAAALLCLSRVFPEGPRTMETADTWLLDQSSIRREAALSTMTNRERDDVPIAQLEAALEREPDVMLRRRMEALLAWAKDGSDESSDNSL